jgi:hypothetical protein
VHSSIRGRDIGRKTACPEGQVRGAPDLGQTPGRNLPASWDSRLMTPGHGMLDRFAMGHGSRGRHQDVHEIGEGSAMSKRFVPLEAATGADELGGQPRRRPRITAVSVGRWPR